MVARRYAIYVLLIVGVVLTALFSQRNTAGAAAPGSPHSYVVPFSGTTH